MLDVSKMSQEEYQRLLETRFMELLKKNSLFLHKNLICRESDRFKDDPDQIIEGRFFAEVRFCILPDNQRDMRKFLIELEHQLPREIPKIDFNRLNMLKHYGFEFRNTELDFYNENLDCYIELVVIQNSNMVMLFDKIQDVLKEV